MCFCVRCDLCGEALRAGSTRINCFPFPAISLDLGVLRGNEIFQLACLAERLDRLG
jgi:hypothetical protein